MNLIDIEALGRRDYEFVFGHLSQSKNVSLSTRAKLTLFKDGRINGSREITESFWEVREGRLAILGPGGMLTTIFDGMTEIGGHHVLTGHSLIGPHAHFIYPYHPLSATSQKLVYIIASNARYSAAVECLLPQLAAAGVASERIWVTLTQSPHDQVRTVDGVTFSHVTENAFEYSALLDVVRRDIPCDMAFLLHDTCHVGPRFRELVESQPWTIPIDYMSAMGVGMFNMGIYRKAFLARIADFLKSLDGLSKRRAIDIEWNRTGDGFKSQAPITSNFLTCFGKKTGYHRPYGTDNLRIGMYLPGADIHKFYNLLELNTDL